MAHSECASFEYARGVCATSYKAMRLAITRRKASTPDTRRPVDSRSRTAGSWRDRAPSRCGSRGSHPTSGMPLCRVSRYDPGSIVALLTLVLTPCDGFQIHRVREALAATGRQPAACRQVSCRQGSVIALQEVITGVLG